MARRSQEDHPPPQRELPKRAPRFQQGPHLATSGEGKAWLAGGPLGHEPRAGEPLARGPRDEVVTRRPDIPRRPKDRDGTPYDRPRSFRMSDDLWSALR